MKLIYCPECKDVVKLRQEDRTCFCGKSGGKYVTKRSAVIRGRAIPLCIGWRSFLAAIRNRHENNLYNSVEFSSWIPPLISNTIKREEEKPEDDKRTVNRYIAGNGPKEKSKISNWTSNSS